MSATLIRCAAVSALLLLLAGCSDGEDEWTRELPETVPAGGVVLLDGKPVEGATVVFAPAPPGKYPATAVTSSDGEFELKAFPSKEGAVPGSYQAGVTKNVETGAGKPKDPSFYGLDAEHAEEAPPPIEYKNVLPQQYADPASSGLTVEIPAGGTSELKIELKSGP